MDTNANSIIRSAAPAAEEPARQRQTKHTGTAEGAVVVTKPADTPTHGRALKAEDESPAYWIAKISKSISFVAGWSVQVGQELTAAKQKLGHGSWMQLFELGGLRISVRTAETLMAVGSHPYFKESNNFTNLPPSYTALYALSRLEPKVIEQGVKEGAIGPGMTIREAKQFVVANQKPPVTPAEPPAFDTEKRVERIKRFLRQELESWHNEHRARLADLLEALANEVRSSTPRDEQSAKGKL